MNKTYTAVISQTYLGITRKHELTITAKNRREAKAQVETTANMLYGITEWYMELA